MTRIVSVVNQKGGVGKTTTAVNFASSLAVLEKRVLLVDMDPQGNATSMSSGKLPEDFKTVYDFMADETVNAVYDTEIPFLKVMPANAELTGAEVELLDVDSREFVLKTRLDTLRDRFDFIIIDSPPSLNILTVNNMTASDGIVVPIQCEYFALEGVSRLMETMRSIQVINPRLNLDGIVLTMYDRRVKLTFDVENEVKEHFVGKVFEAVIPRNVKLSESPSFGMPIILYDITSIGAKRYLSMAEEYLLRFKPEG